MPVSYVAQSDNVITDAFSTIVATIAEDVARRQTLQERLNWLTCLLSRQMAGVRGLGITSFCKGRILAYSLTGVRLPDGPSAYSSLADIKSKLEPDQHARTWIPLGRDQIEADSRHEDVYVDRIGSETEPSGMILVVTNRDRRGTALDDLRRLDGHVAWVIREAVAQHFATLNAELQDLAFRELTSMEYHPSRIAAELAKIFNADATTILVRDVDRLFISATTEELDPSITYRKGESLTGYIFETGEIVNLDDGNDPDEILRKTGVQREHPLYGESISQGQSFRFLGGPIVSRGKVRGVVRLLRKGTKVPFCKPEEKALSRFARILGTHMYTSWKILLGDSLLNSYTDAVCVSRLEEGGEQAIPRVIFANPSAEKIFGKEKEELVGMNAWDLYAPGERERVGPQIESAVRARRQEFGPVKIKILCQGKMKRMADVSYRFTKSPHFWPAAKITIGLIRDVTERYHKEEQHRRLVELLDQKKLAYFRVDTEGRILETSKAEEEITGYSEENLQEMNRDDLYQKPDDRKKLFKQAANDGRLVHTIQRLKKKDGTKFYAEGDIRILYDEETGEPSGYEGLYSDVTDRVKIQDFLDAGSERVLTEPELLESLREYTDYHQFYISGLGHQLRTPLGSLVENLINLKKGIINLDRLDYAIGEARACSLLARNLTYIDQILRAENIERRKTSLAKITFEAVVDFDYICKEKNLTFDLNRKSLTLLFDDVWGHGELLRQVVVILLDNAIKYSFSGSAIKIDAQRWQQEGRTLEVYSSGIPIDENSQEKVFERGYRSRLAKDRVPHGTGMGLWLARKIVEAHGAEIQCRGNVLGKRNNTVFRVIWTDSRGQDE